MYSFIDEDGEQSLNACCHHNCTCHLHPSLLRNSREALSVPINCKEGYSYWTPLLLVDFNNQKLIYAMRVCEEVTTSGLSMAASNRLLKASHAYHNGEGEPVTVQKLMTMVKKSSCHSCKGVSCVMCEVCKSWLISARVACVLCLDASIPQVSCLFKSCDATQCAAFQAVLSSYSFKENKDVLNMICRHNKTAPKNSLQYFSPTEHIGNLLKMNQFSLLVNTSRDEIEATMQYCLKNGIYSYLFSLNCISYYRSLSETHLAELAESYWKDITPPNRIRDFLDFPVKSIDVAKKHCLVPCPCELLLLSFSSSE